MMRTNMNSEDPYDEKLLGKLTTEQGRQFYPKLLESKKRTGHHLKYTKLAAQKFSNNPSMYSIGKSFYVPLVFMIVRTSSSIRICFNPTL